MKIVDSYIIEDEHIACGMISFSICIKVPSLTQATPSLKIKLVKIYIFSSLDPIESSRYKFIGEVNYRQHRKLALFSNQVGIENCNFDLINLRLCQKLCGAFQFLTLALL